MTDTNERVHPMVRLQQEHNQYIQRVNGAFLDAMRATANAIADETAANTVTLQEQLNTLQGMLDKINAE